MQKYYLYNLKNWLSFDKTAKNLIFMQNNLYIREIFNGRKKDYRWLL